MNQPPSVHPLDADDDELARETPPASPRTLKQTLLFIIIITGALSFTTTLSGAALISNAQNSSGEKLGTLLRILGGAGLISCCFALVAVTRSTQIKRLLGKRTASKPRVQSAWFSLLKWNILVFVVAIPVLHLVYLTLGTHKTFWLQSLLWPFEAALVATLASLSQREYRAYWIGFAVMIAFFLIGYDMNAYLRYFLSAANNRSPMFGYQPSVADYQSVEQLAYYQLSRLAWAMLSGLLCSSIVPWIFPNSKPSSDSIEIRS
jgi:hypothetical protein